MKRHLKIQLSILALFLVVLLTGCQFPTELFFAPDSPSPREIAEEATRIRSFAVSPTPTIQVIEPTVTPTVFPCAFAYGEQPLEDETARLKDALVKNSLINVEPLAMAYGENCLDTVNNKVIRFL
ncbi:MAG: hypothetical protein HY835_08965, partial [Anaerolineae bacterium]|nr:hypothetical protein [Anaerolineae bacterium]